jgi:hypothetical protein
MFGNPSNNSKYPTSEVVRDVPEAGFRNGGTGRAVVYATAGGYPLDYATFIPAGLTGGGGSVFGTSYQQNYQGGAGRIFGAGGNARTTSSSATAGSNPGGGGGASYVTSSGEGGTGAVYVYVVAGFVPASAILDLTYTIAY